MDIPILAVKDVVVVSSEVLPRSVVVDGLQDLEMGRCHSSARYHLGELLLKVC